ncbi:MAG: CRISPR-associated RAMP protein [Methanothrix sp.]|nr:MAG: CRISPR-associated RAMP protein [Methanothrix sp.]
MFKRLFNELTLTFDISPKESPLLIKSGRESGVDPTLLDMNFVRTIHPLTGEMAIYLPGSSLKGTLRSYCEKIARTVRPDGGSRWCCDPFDLDVRSSTVFCGKRLEQKNADAKKKPDTLFYKGSCLACRTFGNTQIASHLSLSDAYPLDEPKLEQRDGVAIDRIFNTVAAGPFNMEVVTKGTFRTKMMLRNFQLWQVGLLAVALRELGNGRVPIGFGKSKGFGRVSLTYQKLEISYPGRFSKQDGIRDFSRELIDLESFDYPEKEDYGLFAEKINSLKLKGEGANDIDDGKFGRITTGWNDTASIEEILNSTIGNWRDCALSKWSPSEE